jgi:purine-nucleoside phosphorylase
METSNPSFETIGAAADYIREQTSLKPKIGLILGSGMGPLADEIQEATAIPYEKIPHLPQTRVAGHAGRMVIGQLPDQSILAMQRRVH